MVLTEVKVADRVLFLYSSVDGQTRRICERMLEVLRAAGIAAQLASLDGEVPELAPFSCVVVGASIRYGKHRPNVLAFIREHASTLRAKRFALFSVNVVARKPAKSGAGTNPYMRKLLRQIGWQPALVAVFAGRIDYPAYDFWDRTVIRFIMLMTRGPTDTNASFEFTDWRQVEDFARRIRAM